VKLAASLGCALAWAWAAAGCGDESCASISDPVARENCQFELVSALYDQGDEAWKGALADVDSPASRDLIRLRLAVQDPARAPLICREVETRQAQAKCQQVAGRPHLMSPPQGQQP